MEKGNDIESEDTMLDVADSRKGVESREVCAGKRDHNHLEKRPNGANYSSRDCARYTSNTRCPFTSP